jgi:hypothetical protein
MWIVPRKKNIPLDLFTEARKFENDGQIETALLTYESALAEVNKIKFNSDLKTKITDKLKMLHAWMDYHDGLTYKRQQ